MIRTTRNLTSLGEKGLRERGSKVASKLREKRDAIRKQRAKQLAEITKRVQRLTDKARTAKARRLRHMICWVVSCTDMVATAFWIGAFPHTHHYYYTFKVIFLIFCRWIWYSWHNDHYYLFDLCYFVNAALMVYLWLLPESIRLFQAVYGFSGVLMLSVPVFRNSFVPHSLDRVTSLQIHVSPVLQLWLLRWSSPSDRTTAGISVLPSLQLYLVWAIIYMLVMFVLRRQTIERRGYGTLYSLFADTYGIRDKLPRQLQGPMASRLSFMLGHFCLFSVGLLAITFPRDVHSLCIVFSIVWSFKNGATFYMNYFWKVYDKQIHAFEQQMARAEAAETTSSHSEESCEHDEGKLFDHEGLVGTLELSFASDGEGPLAE